jgi:hypothetical protein
MADDPNPGLTAELMAALDVIEPEIRGLHYISEMAIPSDQRAANDQQIAIKERRRNLLVNAVTCKDTYITALAALEADGYPTETVAFLDDALMAAIAKEQSDILAATATFKPEQATTLKVSLGPAVPKEPTKTGA